MRRSLERSFQEFRCLKCKSYVHIDHRLSGVHNRNHCPYCLWSRHLDLSEPGDRLAACRSLMKPIGLTLKNSLNKYRPDSGELMLVHHCQDCGGFSINRIAADDNLSEIISVFKNSLTIGKELQLILRKQGISLLQEMNQEILGLRLFGNSTWELGHCLSI